MATDVQIPLADAIRALRRELEQAVHEGTDEDLRFTLGPVELELQVAASTEVGGKAGISFWLVTVGGGGRRTSAATHTVKLSLKPIGPEGGDVIVHSEVEGQPE